MKKALDVNLEQRGAALTISDNWVRWKSAKQTWEAERREQRNYIFATSTKDTTNDMLPWKNSTTLPKLTQIRDNLFANYMAALFPADDWLEWEGGDKDAATKAKANAIKDYVKTKFSASKSKQSVERLVQDWIDHGNAFACVEHEYNVKEITEDGEIIPGYIGPYISRISPWDIVFNPTVAKFEDSPVIIRKLVTLGELYKLMEDPQYDAAEIKESLHIRSAMTQYGSEDAGKDEAYRVDGFSSLYHYYTSGYAELLEFRGDFYDVYKEEYVKDAVITVLDRRTIIASRTNPSWIPGTGVYHVGWRLRPDNLWAMGPLDNLVGMQYRIDHVENAKADAIDQYINPPKKIKGYVEDWDDMPNTRIYCGDDGDVEFLRPPLADLLGYDNELMFYQNLMEEMAGAPKQAMGVRTPGEKTKYEVMQLENAAGRIFQSKTTYFEEVFLEPILNQFLEVGRRNLSGMDIIRTMDNDFGVSNFINVTKSDITANGQLKPRGARHFAAKAKLVQELTQLQSTPMAQDPTVKVHVSGKALAHLLYEELLGLDKYSIVRDNVAIDEQTETQQLMQAAAQQLEVEDQTPLEEQDGEEYTE